MKVHKIGLALNNVYGVYDVYNPLGIIVGSKCLGAHILFRVTMKEGTLAGLEQSQV